jgi:hypothetical protein
MAIISTNCHQLSLNHVEKLRAAEKVCFLHGKSFANCSCTALPQSRAPVPLSQREITPHHTTDASRRGHNVHPLANRLT